MDVDVMEQVVVEKLEKVVGVGMVESSYASVGSGRRTLTLKAKAHKPIRITYSFQTGDVVSVGVEDDEGNLERFWRKDIGMEHAKMVVEAAALKMGGFNEYAKNLTLPRRDTSAEAAIPGKPGVTFHASGVTINVTTAQARHPDVMAAVYLIIDTLKENPA